jgi:cysteine synthase
MSRIYDDITKTVGNTPLVRIRRINTFGNEILLKLESFNPLSSVKDRIGVAMLDLAEKKGLLKPGSVIIEPTSGNTGIALAFASAAHGYRLILTMPDTMSIERVKILKALGAEIVFTPGAKGMAGAIKKAEELLGSTKNAFMPSQFTNPANVLTHRDSTAQEILRDMDMKVDFFIAGVGTGGTITGVGLLLKEKIKGVKIVAVEPELSAVLSGEKPGAHDIQGIGAGFVPDILDRSVIDEIIKVSGRDAKKTARELAAKEGILAGISSGAALFAGIEIAKRPDSSNKRIVVLMPDTGERYLSTDLFDADKT